MDKVYVLSSSSKIKITQLLEVLTLGGLHACTGSNFYSIGPLFNFRVASLPLINT